MNVWESKKGQFLHPMWLEMGGVLALNARAPKTLGHEYPFLTCLLASHWTSFEEINSLMISLDVLDTSLLFEYQADSRSHKPVAPSDGCNKNSSSVLWPHVTYKFSNALLFHKLTLCWEAVSDDDWSPWYATILFCSLLVFTCNTGGAFLKCDLNFLFFFFKFKIITVTKWNPCIHLTTFSFV